MKTPKKRPGRRNAIAATLSQGCFRKRVEAKKTGRGSYRRQPKHRLAGGGLPGLGPQPEIQAIAAGVLRS